VKEYPLEAYFEGTLWWELDNWPISKRPLGDEPRIAAWLAYNKRIGQTFTTDELRNALGNRLSRTSRNNREHFQRRIRELRSQRDGWVFPSAKHDNNVDSGKYRLDQIGWHPSLGERSTNATRVSKKVRREVLTRDHERCFHCGVISGEPYPDFPHRAASMTVGHIVPAADGGSAVASNLRAECALCNEAMRSATSPLETLPGVKVATNDLNRKDRLQLLEWVIRGSRSRGNLDETYDRFRHLAPDDKQSYLDWIRETT